MTEIFNCSDESEMLEVIEGLLDLCMQREAQIAELIMERERPWVKKSLEAQGKNDGKTDPLNPIAIRAFEFDGTESREGVLIVDDTEMMRVQLVQLFRSVGQKVVATAENGEEAIELYRKYHPALVTMDTDMPVMNGYEATREIKKIDPDARVVMISHVLERKMILEAIRCGATDYLVKPVQPERLLQMVESKSE